RSSRARRYEQGHEQRGRQPLSLFAARSDGTGAFRFSRGYGRREKIMAQAAVNPITVEAVRKGLAHIANEMATVLRKTSYNMMMYEVREYCVGIIDPEGAVLSENFGARP